MKRALISLILAGCMACWAGAATAQPALRETLQTMEPGKRWDTRIPVAASEDQPGTFIPVTLIKGASPGPTLLIVAGVHGFEFAPILAAERLAEEVRAEELSGALILVRVANIPSFEGRSPYVNPVDRRNLNRSFPGSADGSQTERIAYTLSTEIIPLADMVLDVHSGDGGEWLEAFIGVYGGPLASEYEKALNIAHAFGFQNIVRYRMETQEQIDTGRSLNRQAVAQGLPTLLVEIGQNGGRDLAHVEALVKGVTRAMIRLGMLGPSSDEPAAVRFRHFDGTQSVPVKNSGIWHPAKSEGGWISEGEVVGVVQSYSGELVETVTAPVSGYRLYGLAGPPVRAGDSVLTIATPTESLN